MGLRRAGPAEDRPQGAGARGDREHLEGRPGLSEPAIIDIDIDIDATFALIGAMPPAAVLGIFARYGKPLAVSMPDAAPDDRRALLALSEGSEARIRVLQVLGYGDVIPNDYFVLERAGEGHDDPLAVPGPLFSAALAALARAAGVV